MGRLWCCVVPQMILGSRLWPWSTVHPRPDNRTRTLKEGHRYRFLCFASFLSYWISVGHGGARSSRDGTRDLGGKKKKKKKLTLVKHVGIHTKRNKNNTKPSLWNHNSVACRWLLVQNRCHQMLGHLLLVSAQTLSPLTYGRLPPGSPFTNHSLLSFKTNKTRLYSNRLHRKQMTNK